jgi:hypothetical protein
MPSEEEVKQNVQRTFPEAITQAQMIHTVIECLDQLKFPSEILLATSACPDEVTRAPLALKYFSEAKRMFSCFAL